MTIALDEPPGDLPAYGYLVLTGLRSAALLDDREALNDLATRSGVLSPFGVPGVLRQVI